MHGLPGLLVALPSLACPHGLSQALAELGLGCAGVVPNRTRLNPRDINLIFLALTSTVF